MISPRDLSVVVQGAVSEWTRAALTSVRRYFPGAELILSTWEDADVADLDFDKVVFSIDPGGVASDSKGTLNNLNRQLLSTKSGLSLASRPYILKTRTDIVFSSQNILNYFGKFPVRDPVWSLFDNRVLISSVYARYCFYCGRTKVPAIFHPSDLIFFGNAKDIRDLFSIPLVEEPAFSQYFLENEKQSPNDPYPAHYVRFFPEQYIWYSFVSKYREIRWKHRLEYSENLFEQSIRSIVNNFIILDFRQCGITLPKHNLFLQEKIHPAEIETLFDYFRFARAYRKYCDRSFLPLPNTTTILSVPGIFWSKLRRNYNRIYLVIRNGYRGFRSYIRLSI